MGSSRYCIRQRLEEVPHAADIFLWRNKKQSAGVLGGATILWVLFECLEYRLLALVCHCLILSLAILFVWSNAAHFINKSAPHIPHLHIPEEPVLQIAFAITIEINMGFAILRNIASGKDLKKFLTQLIFSCGGTRSNQQECLVGQLFCGFCLNALNTICSL